MGVSLGWSSFHVVTARESMSSCGKIEPGMAASASSNNSTNAVRIEVS